MVAEEMEVSLSGGAPWGFRLQGGADQQKPLQVAKVRRRSKACRAGLKEHDELVAIGDHACSELSHAQAMSLIDTQSATLTLRVKRTSGFLSSTCPSTRVPSPPTAPVHSHRSSILSPTALARDITSPPDSEAYYGETDSDADTRSHTQRRQRRTPPHARSPARYGNQDEEETSEMSGYESAPDAGVSLQGLWDGQSFMGTPRREPLHTEWSTPAHTLTPTPDRGLVEAEGEGDSGFQEAGGGVGLSCPPLVSPERAKEALMLGSGKHLVPMVGPQQNPVSDELSTTYMDKARQAKLQRGESLVEKQVKEARSKCRSIASLLTDAPNPNSKGVLMFKKRRQRAKKYTLTCFGKAEGDKGEETEGETGGETEEEGGSSILSGSEVDEGGFSASFDSTWDSGYLDLLDRRSSACPSNTPTTPTKPTANHSPGLDALAYQTAGLIPPSSQNLALEEDSGLESSATKQPHSRRSAPMSPPAVVLTNGRSVAVSRASVVLSPPGQTGPHRSSPPRGNSNPGSSTVTNPDLHAGLGPNPGVLNRTARPFAPAPSPPRATVTSVMFRPPQPKPMVAAEPVAAVSMATIAPTQHPPGPDARRAVSSTSLYIPPRNNNGHSPRSAPTPTALSPPSSLPSAPFTHPPANAQPFTSPPSFHVASSTPFSPSAAQSPPVCPSSAQPFSPLTPHPPPPTPTCPPSANCVSPTSPPFPPNLTQVSFHSQPTPHPPAPTQHPLLSVQPHASVTSAVAPGINAAMATAPPPHAPAADSPVAREQRISVPAARTGILHDARRRSNKKPMFSSVQNRDVSPNPDLLSMVQNMDGGCGKAPVAPSMEAGHESGPEEDWLRLGAEACNFMQAQRGCRPPPVAPKPQAPPAPQLAGKGGQLFARRQTRMDRYVVERSPSVAAAPYSPAQTREPSPTPSLPATWKYSPNIRAPPPISYNPLLSPSCPPKAQKKCEVSKPGPARPKGQKAAIKPVDVMNHKPHQLSSTLFSYGNGAPQDSSTYQQQRGTTDGPQKTARVREVKRFSTPPPTGPALKVLVPRSATTLGEPLWRSDVASPPPFQPQPAHPQWATSQRPHPTPPAPTAPLPQLPSFSCPLNPVQPNQPHLRPSSPPQTGRPFKSAPDLSPLDPAAASRQPSGGAQSARVPRPRFSTSNMGLQPCVWRPGSTTH